MKFYYSRVEVIIELSLVLVGFHVQATIGRPGVAATVPCPYV